MATLMNYTLYNYMYSLEFFFLFLIQLLEIFAVNLAINALVD